MCNEKVDCRVLVPAHLSHTGKAYRTTKPIDKCISDLVEALNHCEIYTSACCCGHGEHKGEILLQDGRILTIDREGKPDMSAWDEPNCGTVFIEEAQK